LPAFFASRRTRVSDTSAAFVARVAESGWTCHLAFKWTVDQSVEKDRLSTDDTNKAPRADV